MAAMRESEIADSCGEVYRVEQIKYNIDAGSPLWRRVFFRAVYLPFIRLSLWLGIPIVGAKDESGRFSWVEDQGTYTDYETAVATCQGEFWRVRKATLNLELPAESVQAASAIYPRSAKPDRERGKFPTTSVPLDQMREIQENLKSVLKSTATT